jgi:hypothetical protein
LSHLNGTEVVGDILDDDDDPLSFTEWFFEQVALPTAVVALSALLVLIVSVTVWATVKVWIAVGNLISL